MTTDLIGILRRTDLLRSVSAQDLKAVAAASRLRTFRRGQIVFTRGDPGDTLIVVISGHVKVVVRSADGGELTLTIIPSGGVLGELSIADGGPEVRRCRNPGGMPAAPGPAGNDPGHLRARAVRGAGAATTSIAAILRRLTEEASDLVFLDLPRRVAKVLLSQARGDDSVIRLLFRARKSWRIKLEVPGKASTPRCAVSSGEAGSRCTTGP